jgi:hypothetical protein
VPTSRNPARHAQARVVPAQISQDKETGQQPVIRVKAL